MKKIICLLILVSYLVLLCACGNSVNNSVDTQVTQETGNETTSKNDSITAGDEKSETSKKEFDFSQLSKNTTFEDIINLLGDNHSDREDVSRSIVGEVFDISYPEGTVLSGLVASSSVFF